MAAETEAMGGEEFPLIDVGPLHRDWQVIYQGSQRTLDLVRFQVNHAEGDTSATGGLVVDAHPSWGFGPTGSFGDATLTDVGDEKLEMTLSIEGESSKYDMIPEGPGWTTQIVTTSGDPFKILLVKPDQLAQAEAAVDGLPVDHNLIAVDERGTVLTTPVNWTLVNTETDEQDTFQSTDGRGWDKGRLPGTYRVTATSGSLVSEYTVTLGRGERGANLYVMKPSGEGADLALDLSYFCVPGEDCDMEMNEIPIDFTLPEGWGAERPIPSGRNEAMFNMTTNTPDGPFFASLNQPQRSADLGPCVELVSGTFCHDATDDPALLADIAILQRSLSFKATGQRLNQESLDTLLNQLTGDTQ